MKPILRRGLVLRLKNMMCVVLLEMEGGYGWTCLSLDDIGPYCSQDILVFYNDLEEGEVLLNKMHTTRSGATIE